MSKENRICLFGAGHHGTTFINLFNLSQYFEFVVDLIPPDIPLIWTFNPRRLLFNNLSDKGTDGNRLTPSPVVRAPLAYQTRRLQELQTEIDKLRQRLRGPMSEADVTMATWIAHRRRNLESPNISDDKPLPAVQLDPWHVIGPFQAAKFRPRCVPGGCPAHPRL